MNRKRAGIGVALAALMTLVTITGCRVLRETRAEFNRKTVKVGNVAEFNFGDHHIGVFPFSVHANRVTVTPTGRPGIAAATFRVYRDANGDGQWNEGESVQRFEATTSADGLEINDISVSAGEVAGSGTVNWQVNVTDLDGGEHVSSGTFY